MSIRTFCDVCGEELNRNMVPDPLTVETGDFSAEVIVTPLRGDKTELCYDCLMKMLNTKPKRKYARKPKPEQVETVSLGGAPYNPSEVKPENMAFRKDIGLVGKGKSERGEAPLLPDISTFSLTIGQINQPHTLSLGKLSVVSMTLKQGAKDLLLLAGVDEAYVEAQPDSPGKRELLGILKEEQRNLGRN